MGVCQGLKHIEDIRIEHDYWLEALESHLVNTIDFEYALGSLNGLRFALGLDTIMHGHNKEVLMAEIKATKKEERDQSY